MNISKSTIDVDMTPINGSKTSDFEVIITNSPQRTITRSKVSIEVLFVEGDGMTGTRVPNNRKVFRFRNDMFTKR